MPHFELTETPLLSRAALDRAEELRADTDALRAGWANAFLLRVNPRGQVRVADGELVLEPASTLGDEPANDAVFLGLHGTRHVWAVRVPAMTGELGDLRMLGHRLDESSAGLLTTAVALLNWHDHAGYSAIDGAATEPTMSGWSRISSSTGHEEFPRTDPAVICLVHDGADRVLLARQPVWPPRMFSVLAGFVEAGESLETCVVREIREEVGLDVHDVRYLGSQPWPFPRSVMIGFSAVGDPAAPLEFADGEIAEAHWFTREQIRSALDAGDWTSRSDAELLLPGSISIARVMIESWAATD
ncbi:NAD(+) diphosphatase [Rhodococcus hoagii]|uniref:NAD(+) diphosphatase n=2 Tax=Rhodococcus hoagii TaxID=43767 RepID=A0AAE5MIH3_RHOHA|nr:NAD(+) diphosphatase [Prescottella equi]MBU4616620.1 NAD(+) diphosphatase [Rhodococcus sp. GG48]GBF12967.1 NADH pyrophosphatase [Rhodococcus sp. Br-6]AVP69490.1 NAD(+) diphosphatase [Prescottella equi]ERN44170.1 NADH pyrophosphatase [Prescottella equi NBRC 101255 = C 7]MBM4473066.1 NAD(+) diphosphatase [Prescottella equi]